MKRHLNWLLTLSFCILTLNAQAATIQSTSISHTTLPRNAIGVPFLHIDVATDDNPLLITTIIARKTGLSTNQDIDRVMASGNYGRSFRASVDNDDLVRLRFLRGYYIPPNSIDRITLSANLDVQGHNRTIGFELIDIESDSGSTYNRAHTTRNRNRNYNHLSRQRYSARRTSNTSSYAVPELDFEILSNGGYVLVGRSNRIGRFRIKNKSRKQIHLGQLTLRNIGSANLEDMFDTLELKDNNGWTIARSKHIDSNYVTFDLENYPLKGSSNLIISAWGNARYGKINRTIQLVLDDKGDLTGTVGSSRYPTSSRSRNRSGSRSYTRSSNNYISGSNPTSVTRYSRGLWNRNYNPGENQITFLADRLSFKAPVKIDTFRAIISPSSRVADHNGNGYADREDYETAFENFRLFINGEYIDQTRQIEGHGGRIFLEFSVGEPLTDGNEFRVVGDISRQAQNGDKLKLTIDRSFSFPEWEYLR